MPALTGTEAAELLTRIAVSLGISVDDLLTQLLGANHPDISRIRIEEKRVTIRKFDGDAPVDDRQPVETVIIEDGRQRIVKEA